MILDSYFTSKVTGVGFLVIYVADINAGRLSIEHYRGRFPIVSVPLYSFFNIQNF